MSIAHQRINPERFPSGGRDSELNIIIWQFSIKYCYGATKQMIE